jgi:hypothetical protein
VVVPFTLLLLLAAVPYLDRNPARRWQRRPLAITLGLLLALGVGVLTYMGTASYGIALPPAVAIVEQLAPEEGVGEVHRVPYATLMPGSYALEQPLPASISPELAALLATYARLVADASATGALPQGKAFLDIVERQADLKAVTLHIQWQPADAATPQSYARTIYLHRERSAGATSQYP